MVPQYVVPELFDSKLSPYVPYSAKTVSQPAMTAEDLFETLYRIDVEKNTQEMIDNGETPANFGAMMERMFKTDNAPGEKKVIVPDGINSVGDYNFSRVGVVCVCVCLFVCLCPHLFSCFTIG